MLKIGLWIYKYTNEKVKREVHLEYTILSHYKDNRIKIYSTKKAVSLAWKISKAVCLYAAIYRASDSSSIIVLFNGSRSPEAKGHTNVMKYNDTCCPFDSTIIPAPAPYRADGTSHCVLFLIGDIPPAGIRLLSVLFICAYFFGRQRRDSSNSSSQNNNSHNNNNYNNNRYTVITPDIIYNIP